MTDELEEDLKDLVDEWQRKADIPRGADVPPRFESMLRGTERCANDLLDLLESHEVVEARDNTGAPEVMSQRFCENCGSEIPPDSEEYCLGNGWSLYCDQGCKDEDAS